MTALVVCAAFLVVGFGAVYHSVRVHRFPAQDTCGRFDLWERELR